MPGRATSIAKLVAVVTAATVLSATPALAQVQNGGFETGDFTGWTLSGNSGFRSVTANCAGTAPHSGAYEACFGAVGSPTVLSQTVTDAAGQNYALSFWLANTGGTPNFFSASFNGTTLYSASNLPEFGYTQYTYSVVGTGSDNLEFQFQQDPAYFAFDDVSLSNVTTTPEPSSMALLGSGLIGLVPMVRRRRR